MAKKYKKSKGNSGASYSGPVTGPNAPSISAKLKGGNNNKHQTVETAKASYVKARGD